MALVIFKYLVIDCCMDFCPIYFFYGIIVGKLVN